MQAGDAYLLINLYEKLTSLETQVKHQRFSLGLKMIISIIIILNYVNFISSPPSPLFPFTPPLTLPPLDSSEVVNTGELIITNFIDGEVTDYRKIAHTLLVALHPTISDSGIILARPLSIVP